uniref:Uncharacterized protein n=1 Tax=Gopherus agassizii TaxID=38772 RepID=A0A452HVI8_9SAUR
MTSKKAHERARAVRTSVLLVRQTNTLIPFPPLIFTQTSHKFPRLGLLIGQLSLRVGDPEKEIGRQAMEGLYFLYSLMWCQKGKRGLSELGGPKAPACEQLDTNPNLMMSPYRNRCPAGSPTSGALVVFLQRFRQFLSPDQMADLLLTAVERLKEANESTIEASRTILNVILEKYKQKIQMEVDPSQLRAIHHSHARQVVMMTLCLLARAFMEEVSTALLKCPLPLDRDAAGMWRTLAKTEAICHSHRLLDVLLNELQERPSTSEDRAFIIPLAAASALYELLSISMCTPAATCFYPHLLTALLVQVHYTIGLSLPDSRPPVPTSVKEAPSLTLPHVCCVVKTVKTLLLKMGCHYEFTSVEEEGGWELLTSSEEHHREVGHLFAPLVHYSCCELWWILYLLVPFLERGDKQHKITAMAFFVEVKWLPEKYSVLRLLKGLTDPDPVIRALCVKGLITMADWPWKVRWNPFHYTIDIRVITPEVSVTLKCKNALDECSRLLEWRLPKQVGNRKAWHNHQEDVDEICQYLVSNLWFLINIFSFVSALTGLLHDPEVSVCIFAAQAHERILAVYWKLKYGLVEQHKVNSDSAEKHKSPPNPPATEGTHPGCAMPSTSGN